MNKIHQSIAGLQMSRRVVHSRRVRFQAASCCAFCTWSLKPPLPLLSPFALILTFHYKEAGYTGRVNGHHVVGSDGDYCGR